MGVDLLPGYEHRIIPGAGHGGLPGPRRIILHTTETGPGSMEYLIRSWQANWGSGLPHFVAEGSRYVQLLPLSTCAYTSKDGGVGANKVGTPIQVEIIHFAKDPFSDEEYEALGKWVADLSGALVGVDLDACPRFYGAGEGITLATPQSSIRMSHQQWATFNGICGHQHIPGNDHWDPGHLDIERVCNIARGHDTTKDDDDMAGIDEKLAALAFDIAGHIERARVSIETADAQNAENVSAVVREAREMAIKAILDNHPVASGIDTAALAHDIVKGLIGDR